MSLRPIPRVLLLADARKIGIWVFIFLCSPYCGPFFGGFMVDGLGGAWRPTLWLVFAYSVVILVSSFRSMSPFFSYQVFPAQIAIICLADETWYDRTLAVQPERSTGALGRINDLIGVTAFRQRKYKATVYSSVMRLVEVSCPSLCFARDRTSSAFVDNPGVHQAHHDGRLRDLRSGVHVVCRNQHYLVNSFRHSRRRGRIRFQPSHHLTRASTPSFRLRRGANPFLDRSTWLPLSP
jgi:hypothetical protein